MQSANYSPADINRASGALYGGWCLKVSQNSRAQDLNRLMNIRPPRIILFDALNYPFDEDNKLIDMPQSRKRHFIDLTEDDEPPKKAKLSCEPIEEETSTTSVITISADKHSLIDHEEVYICDNCNECYTEKNMLQAHLINDRHFSYSGFDKASTEEKETFKLTKLRCFLNKRVDVSDEVYFLCPVCYMPFYDKLMAWLHSQHHDLSIMKCCLLSQPPLFISSATIYSNTKCIKCDKEFSKAVQLHKHWQTMEFKCSPFPDFSSLENKRMVLLINCGECKIKSYFYLTQAAICYRRLIEFKSHLFSSVHGKFNCKSGIQIGIRVFNCDVNFLQTLSINSHSLTSKMILKEYENLRSYYKTFLYNAKTYQNKLNDIIQRIK